MKRGRKSGVLFKACLVCGCVRHPSKNGEAWKRDRRTVCIVMRLSKTYVKGHRSLIDLL